jgi:hypothetical protein
MVFNFYNLLFIYSFLISIFKRMCQTINTIIIGWFDIAVILNTIIIHVLSSNMHRISKKLNMFSVHNLSLAGAVLDYSKIINIFNKFKIILFGYNNIIL